MSEFPSKRKIILNLAAANDDELMNALEDAVSIVKSEMIDGETEGDFEYEKYSIDLVIEQGTEADEDEPVECTDDTVKPIYVILKHLPGLAEYTCWVTYDPGDDASGTSYAGFSGTMEAFQDAISDLGDYEAEYDRDTRNILISDLTSLREKAIDMKPGEFDALVRDVAVPYKVWSELIAHGSDSEWFLTTKDNYFFRGKGPIKREELEGVKFHENILAMYTYVLIVNSLTMDEIAHLEFFIDTKKNQFFDTRGVGAEIEEKTPEQFLNTFVW